MPKTSEDPPAVGSLPTHPSFAESVRVWLKIGLLSFGGPAGQIALMHRELVGKRRWLSERRFLHALNFCMLLPGPEAQQLAVYTGWLLHKTRGGLVAGALFVLPGAFLMWLISCVYVWYGKLPWIEALFYGLKAAVMAVVIGALFRIAGKVLRHPALWGIAAASFAAIFGFGLPFPMVVLSALAIGLAFGKHFPEYAGTGGLHAGPVTAEHLVSDDTPIHIPRPTLGGTMGRLLLWLGIWLLPLSVCLVMLDPSSVLVAEGFFFSKAALVTFGGAYAVLPYVAQQAVEVHGWLNAGQMIDGLGLAETTPGPLILVLQFVGFLGGWNHPGGLPPLAMATLAAAMTTWCTFVPGYLFIFTGGPFIEHGRGNQRLRNALPAVTAAVVGVILNLTVWFCWNSMISESGDFDPIPPALAAIFLFLLQTRKWGVIPVVALGAAAGLALHLAGFP